MTDAPDPRPMRHRFFTSSVRMAFNAGDAAALRRRGFVEIVEPADAPALRATDAAPQTSPSNPPRAGNQKTGRSDGTQHADRRS